MPHVEMKKAENIGDVKLFTQSGEYVTTVRTMDISPDVIQWGARYFIMKNGAYREASFWTSFEAQR